MQGESLLPGEVRRKEITWDIHVTVTLTEFDDICFRAEYWQKIQIRSIMILNRWYCGVTTADVITNNACIISVSRVLKPNLYSLRMRSEFWPHRAVFASKCFAGVEQSTTVTNYSFQICDLKVCIKQAESISMRLFIFATWLSHFFCVTTVITNYYKSFEK